MEPWLHCYHICLTSHYVYYYMPHNKNIFKKKIKKNRSIYLSIYLSLYQSLEFYAICKIAAAESEGSDTVNVTFSSIFPWNDWAVSQMLVNVTFYYTAANCPRFKRPHLLRIWIYEVLSLKMSIHFKLWYISFHFHSQWQWSPGQKESETPLMGQRQQTERGPNPFPAFKCIWGLVQTKVGHTWLSFFNSASWTNFPILTMHCKTRQRASTTNTGTQMLSFCLNLIRNTSV